MCLPRMIKKDDPSIIKKEKEKTNSKPITMESNRLGRSENLIKLSQRLHLLKPNHNPDISDTSTNTEGSEIRNSLGELVFQGVKPNRAAVLICLFEGEKGDIRVILTKRSSTMSSHSGEVALPGGKWEQGDVSYAETALREAKEEIGLDPSIIEIVTILESFQTKRNITVFPVIGILWDKNAFNPVPNAAEVESIFDAPLEMFLKDENRREEEREWMGYKYLLHFFDYRADNRSFVIWALTAAILIKAASVVYQRPPSFEERRPEFWNRRTRENIGALVLNSQM